MLPPPKRPHVLDLGFVHRQHGLTPVALIERYAVEGVGVEQREVAGQVDADVVQRPAEDAVTAGIHAQEVHPAAAQGRLEEIAVPPALASEQLLHGGAAEHEPWPTIGEVRERLRLSGRRQAAGRRAAHVQRLVVVEVPEEPEHVVPDDVRVRLVEEVPPLVRAQQPGPLDHGQELVLVEQPAVQGRRRLFVRVGGGLPVILLVLVMDFGIIDEVVILEVIGGWQLGDDVDHLVPVQGLFCVGDHQEVVYASRNALQLRLDPVPLLVVAHLEHRLDHVVRQVAGKRATQLLDGRRIADVLRYGPELAHGVPLMVFRPVGPVI